MAGRAGDEHPVREEVLHDRVLVERTDLISVRFRQLLQVEIHHFTGPVIRRPAQERVEPRSSVLRIRDILPERIRGWYIPRLVIKPEVAWSQGTLMLVLKSDGVAELMQGDALPIVRPPLIKSFQVERFLSGPGDRP